MYQQLAQETKPQVTSCDDLNLDSLAMPSWNIKLFDSAQVLFNDNDSTVMSRLRPINKIQKNASLLVT